MSAPQLSRINPDGLAKPSAYAQVVQVPAGTKLVVVSGQVSQDEQGETVPGDLATQTRLVLRNLQTALAGAGASMHHLVRLNWYVVNLNPTAGAAIREVRSEFLPPDALPASTMVGVTALYDPQFLVELEAIAAIPA